ncbi:hypothetical protein MTR67_052211 [Solanum verrucosum]|uniref:Retrotransposon gag domain-containing protein n=1 Tax=Solanum verrucosum TaxID=315347 RepID=A0AAF0V8X9_SOLVR|nr:hypothetical protein MTR67_052211 [Solanum verrucosum]
MLFLAEFGSIGVSTIGRLNRGSRLMGVRSGLYFNSRISVTSGLMGPQHFLLLLPFLLNHPTMPTGYLFTVHISLVSKKWLVDVESRGEDFKAYQLDGPVRQCWYIYMKTRRAGSPPVSWTEFSESFLARFVPRSLRDRLCDQFSRLEHGSMTVFEYEARFQ